MTEADFAKAIAGGAEAAQKAAQHNSVEHRREPHAQSSAHEKAPGLLETTALGDSPQNRGMGDIGLEPMTPSLSSWCSNQLS